ncbi:pyrimidine/purine nucleoside phosphorylase [Ottowia sp.]|uniref:pyrimidine/purine nucleoside phosphorylase n=1 Tax=Ottowia sp. TaxID=1898956 RepID=UPI003A8590D4
MTTSSTTVNIPNVTLNPQANVYFGGQCVSHSFTLADGTQKSAGVVLPATLTFNTGAAEIMECVAGGCDYKLAGSDAWVHCGPGQQFSIAANSSFDIRVAEAFHYICHYG